MHGPQALTKTLEAGERTRGDFFVETTVLRNARREADHLAQSIDDDELTVRVARDDHVEAVGSEIDGRKDVRNRPGGRGLRNLRRSAGL